MELKIFSLIIVIAAIAALIVRLFWKKKISVLLIIMILIVGLVLTIQQFDNAYYKDIFSKVKKPDLAVLIASIVVFGYAFILNLLPKKKIKVSKKEKEKVIVKDDKLQFLNLLNEPIAFYSKDKKVYVLNQNFRKMIGCINIELALSELLTYVHPDDKDKYQNNNNEVIEFRLKIRNNYEWFEEKLQKEGNEVYRVISKATGKLGKSGIIGTYKDLEKDIQKQGKKPYGIVLISIFTIKDSNKKDVIKKELRDILVAKYIVNIMNSPLKNSISVYKLANLEFGILINNDKQYSSVVRELNNRTSDILSQEFEFNNEKYSISNKLGVVLSSNVKVTHTFKPINAAFEMLQMVVSPRYSLDFAIYHGPKEGEPTYSLKDIGIDLDIDLDKIRNE